MAEHNQLGQLGEEFAADFLQSAGCRILFRNWRYRKAEIDLIVLDANTLVFVEVKTRMDGPLLPAETSVTLKKQRLLISAAQAFIEMNSRTEEARFDIITVVLGSGKPAITHIKEAFYPTLI
jgi:putative endonuclease